MLLQEELGDVLLQVVFHARMEEEAGRFGFSDVCDGICKKLVERHPHVFGEVAVSGTGEVLSNWDRIKQELMRSEKVQHRAAKAGFDYTGCDWAMRDLESELSELKEAVGEGDQAHIEEELGDLLFSAVNVARFVKADPEHALTNSCEKFIRRFEQVETLARKRGIDMKTTPIEELDRLWKEIKQK